MECKFHENSQNRYLPTELIDTLWNVNRLLKTPRQRRGCELIDTLWNVNLSHSPDIPFRCARINRYIMECKLNNSSSTYS